MQPRVTTSLLFILITGIACGDAAVTAPDGAAALPDSAAATDGSPETVPLPGFGDISGPCGFLDTELSDPAPSYAANDIAFALEFDENAHLGELTDGGREIIADGNAGGSSLYSEVFAYEVLYRCERAALIKTETEIAYEPSTSKKTDLLVEIGGMKIGVSVTRAVDFPQDETYTVEQALGLLEDKLTDITESSANVVEADRWVKQILHVMAFAPPHAASLETAWGMLDDAVKADTIVLVTVTGGADGFIY